MWGKPAIPDIEQARSRALSALRRHASAPDFTDDPFAGSTLLALRQLGEPVDALPLLRRWRETALGYGRFNRRRYRWGLPHRAEPGSLVVKQADDLGLPTMWRPREREALQDDPSRYVARLCLPILLIENLELLIELAQEPASADLAQALLDEALPTAEADLAAMVMADDPWLDTLMLWLLSRRPAVLRRFEPLPASLATRYAVSALRDGRRVLGIHYPFHREQLISATAQLAAGLWTLGLYPTLLPDLLDTLRQAQRADGGYADPEQPSDLFTTLVVAETMLRLDPGYDPTPALDYLVAGQEPAGWWRALDPETPWLTATVLDLLDLAEQPFSQRWRWPQLDRSQRDRRSTLASYAYFDDLAASLERLPQLTSTPLAVAFCDLAGFGRFNNAHGQATGDVALAAFGSLLAEAECCMPVRDGGDEFLLIGTPGRAGLRDELERILAQWPDRLAAAVPDASGVGIRVVLTATDAPHLRQARTVLGERIGQMKGRHPSVDGYVIEVVEPVAGEEGLELPGVN